MSSCSPVWLLSSFSRVVLQVKVLTGAITYRIKKTIILFIRSILDKRGKNQDTRYKIQNNFIMRLYVYPFFGKKTPVIQRST